MNFLDNYFKYENGLTVCGLTDELNVFYVLKLFKESNKSVVVLTSTLYEANKYYNLFQTYTNDASMFLMDDFLNVMIKASSPELRLSRLNTLEKITTTPQIIITNLTAYLKFLPSVSDAKNSILTLEKGMSLNRSTLIDTLVTYGYNKESMTTSTGEYSVRGMIVDAFLINESHPIRIEFDDDIISSIRFFDENTQRTINEVDSIIIKPISEIETITHSSLYDYVSGSPVIYIDSKQIEASYIKLQNDILEYKENNHSEERLMFDLEDINPSFITYLNPITSKKNDYLIECYPIDNFNEDFDLLKNTVNKWISKNKKVIFCLSNDYQIKRIKELGLDVKIVKQKINNGFILDDLVIISEFDIENVKHNYKYQNNYYGGKKITNYSDLQIGDYVVHISHGIGIYKGIVMLESRGIKKDYIQLEYLKGDKIYVPVEKISNIYKYSDKDGVVPKLNQLNSSSWLKTRAYVQKKAEDISKELIKLYQERINLSSDKYISYPEEDIFASEFIYTVTPDQDKAIHDIYNDLESSHPMDRLLCGDVGFGKTEVAFRAIFKTILNNKQVVYLCPTTILSKQQYMSAKSRFANWPIEIALLNRFTTPSEIKRIYEGLEKGTIDLVFGTHKLLNDDIKYKSLGLMVVDEEQRFGVKHKEKIKSMKNDVNVLTLSATPIPRTLKMALSGLRDLSIIDTPPQNRYPIQTYVVSEDDYIIKDSIYKELARGGQVYILFNNIEKIEEKTNHIRKLIPGEEIRFAHGRMDKTELEDIMEDFINQKFSIIVCTTIIENGIDIPLANTLIVYDADRLGLSQLYQLRGRVGRSDKIAYAYLMYNDNKMLNDIAIKRLNTIKEFTELGSGYKIAMRDLSLRGSGDIFGSNQAGFVDSVGISLYMKMIEDEMHKQKGEPVIEDDLTDNSLISVETHIDDNYVSDEDIKIEIHKLINEIDSYDKLNEVKSSLEDRFGKISETLENYMYEEWFEKIANNLGITKVVQTDRLIEITLPKELSSTIKGDKLLYESLSISRNFKLAYHNGEIKISLLYKSLPEHFIKYIVRLLNTL